MLDKTVIY